MNRDADMVRDQADDPLAVRSGQQRAGIADPFAKPVDPQPAIGIQHHFDDLHVVKPAEIDGPIRRATRP